MALRLKKFHHNQPIGGYTFPVDGHVLTGKNPSEVIRKIAEYRRNNSLPAGDPEHSLAEFVRQKHPWLVDEVDEESPDNPGSEEHLSREYIKDIWSTAPNSTIEPNKQKERFKVCLGCAHYRLLDSDAEVIRKATALAPALLSDIVKGMDHGFCEHHLWVCSVACTLKDQKGLANPQPENTCWYKHNEETKS